METLTYQGAPGAVDLPKEEKIALAVELRAKQWSFRSIGEYIGVTHPTAKKWIEDEHARRSEHRGIDKEAHLAVFDSIQKEAWIGFHEAPETSSMKVGYLNTIKAAEDSKVKITGAEAPKKYSRVDDTFEIVFDDDELTYSEG